MENIKTILNLLVIYCGTNTVRVNCGVCNVNIYTCRRHCLLVGQYDAGILRFAQTW